MVGRLRQGLEHLHEAVEVAAAQLDPFQQGLARHVVAAGALDQDAVAFQHLHGGLGDAPVGQRTFLEILLALDERRRIEDDHVPFAPLGASGLQEIEGVSGVCVHAALHAVADDVGADARHRRRGNIDAIHGAGAERRRPQPPATEVAENIENALAAHIRLQAIAIAALVVEPAGLLAID